MKKIIFIVLAVLAFGCSAFAQDEEVQEKADIGYTGPTVNHTVALGETVVMISKKYFIKPQDIYDLNPTAIDGIAYQTVLIIPSDKKMLKDASERARKANAKKEREERMLEERQGVTINVE